MSCNFQFSAIENLHLQETFFKITHQLYAVVFHVHLKIRDVVLAIYVYVIAPPSTTYINRPFVLSHERKLIFNWQLMHPPAYTYSQHNISDVKLHM